MALHKLQTLISQSCFRPQALQELQTVTICFAHRDIPVRAKKTPAALVSEGKNTFDKSTHTVKKVSLRESQKWVESKKYVFAILEGIRS